MLKKTKILKTLLIALAVVVAVFCCLIFDPIYGDIQYKKQVEEQRVIPKISREEMRSNLIAHEEKFKIVYDYMQTQGNDLYLVAQNYSEIVQDENVKSALKVIFSQLSCDVVERVSLNEYKNTHFIYDGNYIDEYISYVKNPTLLSEGGYGGSKLMDNWYVSSYSYGGVLTKPHLPIPALIIVFVISFAAAYRVLTLISAAIQKLKKPKEDKEASHE